MIVLGARGPLIREALHEIEASRQLRLTILDLGATYARGFASSLLAAAEAVAGRNWLLCTPDHVFDVTDLHQSRMISLRSSFSISAASPLRQVRLVSQLRHAAISPDLDAVALVEEEPVRPPAPRLDLH